MSDDSVGVYAHVPFCERVCPYCDFAVVAARRLSPGQETGYVDALLSELERRAEAFAGRQLASLYLGGGTPSLLRPASVARIIRAVQQTFDAAVVTVSVQYMIRPIEVFSHVRRVLKDGAAFHVIFSNRMFPTKAVAVWQRLDSRGRSQLIDSYFRRSGGWGSPEESDIGPGPGSGGDPVFVVSAARLGAI